MLMTLILIKKGLTATLLNDIDINFVRRLQNFIGGILT